MTKPVVRYKAPGYVPKVGGSALVLPVDHPNHLPGHQISNTVPVRTSAVIAHDVETGVFETVNTIYKPEGVQ